MSDPPGIAFFDLDRTLIAVNSATPWLRRELRLGFLSRGTALRGAWWLGLYQLGLSRMDEIVRSAFAEVKGDLEADLVARTRDFWVEEIRQTIRPGAREAVARHRAAGDRLVLLTSSSPYMCALTSEELGFDGWRCNVPVVVDGRFTGEVETPLCFGEGKAVHARDEAARYGRPLERCSFYTDSFSDLPALEIVGAPVVVSPDPRLARHARQRGWRQEDWGP